MYVEGATVHKGHSVRVKKAQAVFKARFEAVVGWTSVLCIARGYISYDENCTHPYIFNLCTHLGVQLYTWQYICGINKTKN